MGGKMRRYCGRANWKRRCEKMVTEEDVLMAQCAMESNLPNDVRYKVVFEKGNAYFYRHVNKGVGYRGERHPENGWLLAWSDCTAYTGNPPPAFVADPKAR